MDTDILRPTQKLSQRLGEQDVLIVEMMQTEKDKTNKQGARDKWHYTDVKICQTQVIDKQEGNGG